MNLQTTIDFDIKGFFQWWGRELAFLVPKKIRHFLNDQSAILIFTPEKTGFLIRFFTDKTQDEPIFAQALDHADTSGYANFKTKFTEIEKAECVLQLTDAQAIAKQIFLPEAAQENLEQVVGFELDRYTPFTAENSYYTVLPLGKTGYGQFQVLLVLIPQSILDEQLAVLNSWGVQPSRIEFRELDRKFPQLKAQYNLLPVRYRPEGSRLEQSVHWLLNGMLFLMLLIVLIYPVWNESREVDVLKSEFKALEKETRIVEDQQMEIDTLQEATRHLLEIKSQVPEILAVLGELTHLLKDDTWLTNLQYSEKHLQIQGQSPRASALIGLLEESPYFSKVSFVSPLTQDKSSGLERFQISMDVDPQPAESATQLKPEPPGNAAPDEKAP